ETVVAGMIVGDYFADYCKNNGEVIDTNVVKDFLTKEYQYLKSLVDKGKYNVFEIKNRMKEIMWDKVAIFRTGEGLKEAVDELEKLYKDSQD
ncbi:fumarate reductase flavoprotein subunit, partial [Campylobacter jejuni]|nr:fumarate reductase flavoprotein subunit [Campylobacter jejuni]